VVQKNHGAKLSKNFIRKSLFLPGKELEHLMDGKLKIDFSFWINALDFVSSFYFDFISKQHTLLIIICKLGLRALTSSYPSET